MEGGGFRGVYTAGVLDFFIENGLMFSQVYGISAGACNALNYLSQDLGRYIRIAKEYCNDPRYMGMGQLLKKGSFFNWDFSFYEIPEKYIPYSYDTLFSSPMNLAVGATDCEDGSCRWFSKKNGDDVIRAAIASSSMPLLSPMQEIGGRKFLDGGIADSIPTAKARADGWEKQVIVLTRNRGYLKKPNRLMPLIRQKYKQYPQLCRAMQERHLRYNESIELAYELERQGKAVVIQPSEPMNLKRMERDTQKIQAAYENGYRDAKNAAEAIARLFE